MASTLPQQVIPHPTSTIGCSHRSWQLVYSDIQEINRSPRKERKGRNGASNHSPPLMWVCSHSCSGCLNRGTGNCTDFLHGGSGRCMVGPRHWSVFKSVKQTIAKGLWASVHSSCAQVETATCTKQKASMHHRPSGIKLIRLGRQHLISVLSSISNFHTHSYLPPTRAAPFSEAAMHV